MDRQDQICEVAVLFKSLFGWREIRVVRTEAKNRKIL